MLSCASIAARRVTARVIPSTAALSSPLSSALRSSPLSRITAVPATIAATNALAQATRPFAAPATLLRTIGTSTGARMVGCASVGGDLLSLFGETEEEEPLRYGWRGSSGPPAPPELRSGPGLAIHSRVSIPASKIAASGVRHFSIKTSAKQMAADAVEPAAEVEDSPDEAEIDTPEAAGIPGVPLDEVSGISDALKKRLQGNGINSLFPVQRETFVHVLEGKDIVVRSRTGSGKTLGFAIPVVEKLSQGGARSRSPRCIVVTPTRELAKQVELEFKRIAGSLKSLAIYGGVAYQPQQAALRAGIDVVVGTPGRLIDLLESKSLDLSKVEFAILDEADEMLRMGFKEDCEQIFAKMPGPEDRQTMLWSATVPVWVRHLASSYCKAPHFIDLVGEDAHKLPPTATFVSHLVTRTTRMEVLSAVLTHAIKSGVGSRVLVFTDTKNEAYDLAKIHVPGVTIRSLTGDLSQAAREAALHDFRTGKVDVLCATDIAARGLDINDVDMVIHYRLPQSQEAFVHRSGRTARAGRSGQVVCLMERSEWDTLARWEKSLQFDAVVKPAPRMDPKTLLVELEGKIVGRLKRVSDSVLEAVKASKLPETAVKLAHGKLEDALTTALAVAALGLDAGISASGIQTSLLTGEKGLVTVSLQPASAAYEALVGKPSPYAALRGSPLAPVDASSAKASLLGVLDACKVPATDRPRRLFVAPDKGHALIFDVSAETFSLIQAELNKAGRPADSSDALLSELEALPASVKANIVGTDDRRNFSKDRFGDRRRGRDFRQDRGGERDRGEKGGFSFSRDKERRRSFDDSRGGNREKPRNRSDSQPWNRSQEGGGRYRDDSGANSW